MKKRIKRAPLIFSWINPIGGLIQTIMAGLCLFFITQVYIQIQESSKQIALLQVDMGRVKERLNMTASISKMHYCEKSNPTGGIL